MQTTTFSNIVGSGLTHPYIPPFGGDLANSREQSSFFGVDLGALWVMCCFDPPDPLGVGVKFQLAIYLRGAWPVGNPNSPLQ